MDEKEKNDLKYEKSNLMRLIDEMHDLGEKYLSLSKNTWLDDDLSTIRKREDCADEFASKLLRAKALSV